MEVISIITLIFVFATLCIVLLKSNTIVLPKKQMLMYSNGSGVPLVTMYSKYGAFSLKVNTGCKFSYLFPTGYDRIRDKNQKDIPESINITLSDDFGETYACKFYTTYNELSVEDDDYEVDGILGMDFLSRNGFIIDTENLILR